MIIGILQRIPSFASAIVDSQPANQLFHGIKQCVLNNHTYGITATLLVSFNTLFNFKFELASYSL